MAKRTKKLINNSNTAEEVRLNKFLSDAGACSRREADKYIEEGKVCVDGDVATVGTKVKKGQHVTLNGKNLTKEESLVFIALNKPRGIVCTTDRREPDNVIDFLNYGKRIYPIGRLDKDSEGLLLLTNDGDIVNKILRAGNNHEKEYIVKVNKPITGTFLKGMTMGVPILDTVTKPCQIEVLDKCVFKIILTQGLNRQIRRMCEHFEYKVLELKRIRIMNINLGRLKVGGFRNITENEIEALNALTIHSSNEVKLDANYDRGIVAIKREDSNIGKNPNNTGTNYNASKNKTNSKAYHKNSNFSKYKTNDKDNAENKNNTDNLNNTDNKSSANLKDKTNFRDKTNFKDKTNSKDKTNFRDKTEIKDKTDIKDKTNFRDNKSFRDNKGLKDNTNNRTNQKGASSHYNKSNPGAANRSKTNEVKAPDSRFNKGKFGSKTQENGASRTQEGFSSRGKVDAQLNDHDNFQYTKRSIKLMGKGKNTSKKDAYKENFNGRKTSTYQRKDK